VGPRKTGNDIELGAMAPEESTLTPSRRGFLHSAAAAGIGGAALALLGGSQRADAAPGSIVVDSITYTIHMSTQRREVRVNLELQDGRFQGGAIQGDDRPSAVVRGVPVPKYHDFDPQQHAIFAVWWTPYKDISNLLSFSVLDVAVDPADGKRSSLLFVVGPGPCVTEVNVTVLVHFLYGPR
jgi:hypothetical protein